MPRTLAELDALFHALPVAPRERGTVAQICVRPDIDQRAFPEVLELSPERGALGDRWARRTWMHLPDGRPDPRVQVAVANAKTFRWLRELAGTDHHPGDTLLVDLDLAAANLPVGARLRVGTAVIEVTDVVNDGCAKIAKHFGPEVFEWMRAKENLPRRLRGLFARVTVAGRVRAGDAIERLCDRKAQ